tara:strand:- start:164 stop:769 length:606 start_codon:yes stop_codon:yes gene_type:complete
MSKGKLLLQKDMKDDYLAVQEEAKKQQNKQRKKGLLSAVGGVLSNLAVPLLIGTGAGAPLALASKFLMGYVGRNLFEAMGPKVDTDAIKKASEKGFATDAAEEIVEDLKTAQKNLDRQQLIQSIVQPVQAVGVDKVAGMVTEGLTKVAPETVAKYKEFEKTGLFGDDIKKLFPDLYKETTDVASVDDTIDTVYGTFKVGGK